MELRNDAGWIRTVVSARIRIGKRTIEWLRDTMLTVVNEVTRHANTSLDYGGFVVLAVAILLLVVYVVKDVTMMSGSAFERSLSRALDPILFPLFFVFAMNVVTELIDFWT